MFAVKGPGACIDFSTYTQNINFNFRKNFWSRVFSRSLQKILFRKRSNSASLKKYYDTANL